MNIPRKSAFSLVELIIVISVIAIIATIIMPSISGTNEEAKRQNAISAAGALNLAQAQWRMKVGSGWDSYVTSGDSACYEQIKGYLEFSDANWSAFSSRYTPYNFAFQKLSSDAMQKVKLMDKNGTQVNY
jgi:prepilin-type N-terminal cleavage/methylation domain-containing protein